MDNQRAHEKRKMMTIEENQNATSESSRAGIAATIHNVKPRKIEASLGNSVMPLLDAI